MRMVIEVSHLDLRHAAGCLYTRAFKVYSQSSRRESAPQEFILDVEF